MGTDCPEHHVGAGQDLGLRVGLRPDGAVAVLAGPRVTSDTLLLLESVGEVCEVRGHGSHVGHLVYVAPRHHPVDVVHQLGAVRVEGDVRGHPRSQRQCRLQENYILQFSVFLEN